MSCSSLIVFYHESKAQNPRITKLHKKESKYFAYFKKKTIFAHEHSIYSKCVSAHTDDDNKVFDVIGNRGNKDVIRILFIENQIGTTNALDCLNGGIDMSEQYYNFYPSILNYYELF